MYLLFMGSSELHLLSAWNNYAKLLNHFFNVSAEKVGFEDFILPFTTAKGNDILRGVNYASGAAGIRKDTGDNQVS